MDLPSSQSKLLIIKNQATKRVISPSKLKNKQVKTTPSPLKVSPRVRPKQDAVNNEHPPVSISPTLSATPSRSYQFSTPRPQTTSSTTPDKGHKPYNVKRGTERTRTIQSSAKKPVAQSSSKNKIQKNPGKTQPRPSFIESYTARYIESRQRSSHDPKIERQKILSNSFEIGAERTEKNIKTAESVRYLEQLPKPSEMKQQELATFSMTFFPSDSKIYEFDMKNIPQEYNEFVLRELMRGYHVVTIELDINNLTGDCRGNGKIKIRTNYESDVQGVIIKLRKFGIIAQVESKVKGRRNNFSMFFTENWQDRKETSQCSPSKSREAKLRSLQSSIIFE